MTVGIGIAGKACSGKSTSANFIAERYGFEILSFAGPLKEICFHHGTGTGVCRDWRRIMNKLREVMNVIDPPDCEVAQVFGRLMEVFAATPPVQTGEKPRDLLQRLYTYVFADYKHMWIDLLLSRANCHDYVVVDDVRFPEEVERLKGEGWTIIKCTVPEELRRKRYERLYGPASDSILAHESETAIDSIDDSTFDWIVDTSMPLTEQHTIINKAVVSALRGRAQAQCRG